MWWKRGSERVVSLSVEGDSVGGGVDLKVRRREGPTTVERDLGLGRR